MKRVHVHAAVADLPAGTCTRLLGDTAKNNIVVR
jgi:hypothetical protein